MYSFIPFCLNPDKYLSHVEVFNKVFTSLRRGWFPFSYTRVLPESDSEKLKVKYVAFLSHKLST